MLDYKTDAHQVFNRVRHKRYMTKDALYAELALKLGVEERKAHFSNMLTLDEVLRATRILEDMDQGHKAYWRSLRTEERKLLKQKRKKVKPVSTVLIAPKEQKPKVSKKETKRQNTLPILEQRKALEELRIYREKREKYPMLARFCPWLLDRI